MCYVSLAIPDFRGAFAGFACPFGNVPGLGDSRERYVFFLLFVIILPLAFPSLQIFCSLQPVYLVDVTFAAC